jgi:hypothetical protein
MTCNICINRVIVPETSIFPRVQHPTAPCWDQNLVMSPPLHHIRGAVLTAKARQAGAAAVKARADARAAPDLPPSFAELRAAGVTLPRAITSRD